MSNKKSSEKTATPTPIARVLRLVEYVGTREFLDTCLSRRAIKGRYYISPGNFIQEAVLGDTYEVLGSQDDDKTFLPEPWTHDCDVSMGQMTLWLPRCPSCGMPHDYSISQKEVEAVEEVDSSSKDPIKDNDGNLLGGDGWG